jgi:hypothetical protein
MRSVLSLVQLVTLCASANAAAGHHAKPRHVVVNPSRALTLGVPVPGWVYTRPPPPVHYDDVPSYDDPSKFGGQSLGMDP